MHVLRKYNKFILSLHYAEFVLQNGSDFRDNAGKIFSTVPQQNKSKYFLHVQLPLNKRPAEGMDELKAHSLWFHL